MIYIYIDRILWLHKKYMFSNCAHIFFLWRHKKHNVILTRTLSLFNYVYKPVEFGYLACSAL